MPEETQLVVLRGGTRDGQIVSAAMPPRAHREHFAEGDVRWSELYFYASFAGPENHPPHGLVPVMVFMERASDGLTFRVPPAVVTATGGTVLLGAAEIVEDADKLEAQGEAPQHIADIRVDIAIDRYAEGRFVARLQSVDGSGLEAFEGGAADVALDIAVVLERQLKDDRPPDDSR